MNNLKQETIADIVADIRMQNQGLPEDGYALSPLVADLLRLADRIEAAYKNLPGMWIIPAENAKLREENERLKKCIAGKCERMEVDAELCTDCPLAEIERLKAALKPVLDVYLSQDDKTLDVYDSRLDASVSVRAVRDAKRIYK